CRGAVFVGPPVRGGRPRHGPAGPRPTSSGRPVTGKMQILAVMSSLVGGGAEQQMVLLLRHFDRSLADVTLCLLSAHGELLDQLRDHIGVRTPVEVIPNMVDLRAVSRLGDDRPAHPFPTDDAPLLVTAGRLSASKAVDDLLRALAIVNHHRPCNLAVLGDGPE